MSVRDVWVSLEPSGRSRAATETKGVRVGFCVRPVGGALGCLVMILVSVALSVALTILLNLLL